MDCSRNPGSVWEPGKPLTCIIWPLAFVSSVLICSLENTINRTWSGQLDKYSLCNQHHPCITAQRSIPQGGRYNRQGKLDLTAPETSEFSLSGKHLDPFSRDAQPRLPAVLQVPAFKSLIPTKSAGRPPALTHVSREQRLFLECFWGQFYKWKAYPQMPLVTRNFLFFRNTSPTDPQRLRVSGALDHWPQWPDSVSPSGLSLCSKTTISTNNEGRSPCDWVMWPPCLDTASVFKTWVSTCLHIGIFIYESMCLPYSKNDLKRLIRIEKIEQDYRKRT